MEKLLPSTSTDAAIKTAAAAPSTSSDATIKELHPSTSSDAAIERSAAAVEIEELVPSIPSAPSATADDKIEEVSFDNLSSSSSSSSSDSILRNSILNFLILFIYMLVGVSFYCMTLRASLASKPTESSTDSTTA